MKVLVLGGSGYVGQYIVNKLKSDGKFNITSASRRANGGDDFIRLDSTNENQLGQCLSGFDIVINCITGSGDIINHGAKALVSSALINGQPYIIHLSTQSVYGTQEGVVNETASVRDDLGWYGHAKIQAEEHIQKYVESGGAATILRIGCVLGVGSPLWHTRFESWLSAGLLGDLGENGDGWSNLVDVQDIASAILLLCNKKPRGLSIYNLSAPDAPRWNQYIVDLSVALGYTPVKKKSYRLLKLKVYMFGIPQKIMQHLLKKIHINNQFLANSFPPSLLSLFQQSIKLNSELISNELGLKFTNYDKTLSKLKREVSIDE